MSDGKCAADLAESDHFCIATPRLRLRRPTAEDASALWPLVSDSALTTFLAWEPHREIEETGKMLGALIQSQRSEVGYHWIATCEDRVVGLVSLIDVKRKHRTWTIDRAELAYWIGLPFQGLGYATEAAAAVIQYGFNILHLHKIRVYHAADNPGSKKTIEKLGFTYVGQEMDTFQKNGTWHHLKHYEAIRSDR